MLVIARLPLKKSFYCLLLILFSSLQSACILLHPSQWFQGQQRATQTEQKHQISSFRLAIPRPELPKRIRLAKRKIETPRLIKTKKPSFSQPKLEKTAKNKVKNVVSIPAKVRSKMSKREKTNAHIASFNLNSTQLSPVLTRSDVQRDFCDRVSGKLSSISALECNASLLSQTGHVSNKGTPILRAQYGQKQGVAPLGRVLLIGGVHGDELSAVSLVFEWMQFLRNQNDGQFIWDVVPVMNPDGFFKNKPTRTNANGVDLNRNMPTRDWQGSALKYWRTRAKASPRKFPGFRPASEPETRWLVQEIQRFKPDMIISVHAPHNLIDYDAPSRSNAPRKFGYLKGALIGTYPGSLGNYAGVKRGIPVVTIELPSADVATEMKQVKNIWQDMLQWLAHAIPLENKRFKENRRLARAGKVF